MGEIGSILKSMAVLKSMAILKSKVEAPEAAVPCFPASVAPSPTLSRKQLQPDPDEELPLPDFESAHPGRSCEAHPPADETSGSSPDRTLLSFTCCAGQFTSILTAQAESGWRAVHLSSFVPNTVWHILHGK